MAYDLTQFCTDLNRILKEKGVEGLPAIAEKLQMLVSNSDFIAATFSEDMPPGKRELFQDKETGARVLAHVHREGGRGNPHNHGDSWAIYSNAKGVTEMTEWKRVNAATEDHAELAPVAKYTLGPGQARAYPPGAMHSTAHPGKAWVIRVTGCDLDNIPRYRFRPSRDVIVDAQTA